MKAIIDDLIYDTATASLICEKNSVQLFVTKKGNFFYFDKYEREITVVDREYAKNYYGKCQNHSMTYYDAFGIVPQEG